MNINSLIEEVKSLNNNIRVEKIEGYLRVKGDTYHARGRLKMLGFQWNPQVREWYYFMTESDPDSTTPMDQK